MQPWVSLQNDFWGTIKEIPFWWGVATQVWVVLWIYWKFASINQKHYPDMGGDASSVWKFFCCSWTSFCRETNGGVAKCCLFSSGDNKCKILCQMLKQLRKMRLSHDCICNMVVIKVTYDFKPWSMDLLFSVRQKVFSRKRPLLKNLLLSSGNGGPCGSYCIWYDYFKLLLHNCTVLVTNFTVLNL